MNQIYIGSTKNLRTRFKEHNDGKVFYTKRYMPWKLVYYEAFILENLARIREKKLKQNGNALKQLKKRIGLGLSKGNNGAGFTLVELLVVITILSVLVTFILVAMNPFSQLDKAKDAQRKADLTQIRNALDTYYNDTGCYPPENSLPFGSEWGGGSTIYMKKVPQDPDCSKTGYCYVYQTDATLACPQWNVLYTRLSRATNSKTACVYLACGKIRNPKYNYCIYSGNIDCVYIGSNNLPTGVPNLPPTSTPTPTPTPTIIVGQCTCATAKFENNPPPCKDVGAGSGRYCDLNCTQLCQ